MIPRHRTLAIVLLLAGLLPLGFAWFTQHAWEDYYITLRTSRNLVEGHGLVFNPGERVHTFTSPLGVLVPALCTWITGAHREEAALWLFRVLNAGLLTLAALLAWRRLEGLGVGIFPRVIFFGLAFTDSKLVDFSSNGMETAILVFFALWLWAELERTPSPRLWPVGLSCAGLLWTRPDAFILAGALLLPHLVFRRRADGTSLVHWRPVLAGVLLGGLLYAPWFVWALGYYGTPIPHTIIAKGLVTPPVSLAALALIPWRTLTGGSLLQDLFLPAYWFYGNWPAVLNLFAHVLSVIAAFVWLVPNLPAAVRRISLTVFLGSFYLCAIILFPWYSPPWTVFAALGIAGTVDHVLRTARWPWWAGAIRITAALAVATQATVLAATAWEMRIQQRVIEDGIRREIGLWLHRNSAPTDTLFMECLGYIGYYAERKTYDYPGLSSPEVVAAVRSGARRFTEVIDRLHPTWLILRPFEIADSRKPENAALRDYEVVRTWDARARLDGINLLPGRGWLERDAVFIVLRRKR